LIYAHNRFSTYIKKKYLEGKMGRKKMTQSKIIMKGQKNIKSALRTRIDGRKKERKDDVYGKKSILKKKIIVLHIIPQGLRLMVIVIKLDWRKS